MVSAVVGGARVVGGVGGPTRGRAAQSEGRDQQGYYTPLFFLPKGDGRKENLGSNCC